MQDDCLLSARDLVKEFAGKRAVDGISLEVKVGEVLGFLGPNGAGKSTTMKMLTGFLAPTRGEAFVCGVRVTGADAAARARIGYLPEGAPLYGDMSVRAFLDFIASAHGLDDAKAEEAVTGAMSALELKVVAFQRIDTLSKGFKRRVGLAAAILHDPDVLILDEPTDGLDPNQKFQVRRLIGALAQDRAIVISTHILEEVEALCTRAVIISKGAIVADGTPSDLKARSRYKGAISLVVDADVAPEAVRAIKTLHFVSKVEQVLEGQHARLSVLPKPGENLERRVGDLIAEKGWQVHGYGVEAGRLDDVFRTLTEGEMA